MIKNIKNVLILEDQPDAVTLLKCICKSALESPKISHASTIANAREHCLNSYDLALIDLRLPDGLSCDFITEFKTQCPDTPAIVSTLYSDDELVFSALRAGADGYLLKSDGEDKLIIRLKRMLTGEPAISPAIARKLISSFTSPLSLKPDTHAHHVELCEVLTPRELEVLTLIGQGLLAKQVATKLDISYHTVNGKIKSIYRKLGINSRAEATLHASRGGLV